MRRTFYVLTALAVAGLYISFLLIGEHIATVYGGQGDTGICAGAGFSCAEAAKSEYSAIFGLPLACLGGAWYLTLLILAGLQRFKAKEFSGIPDVFLSTSLLATLGSIFLAIISVAQLGSLCPLCMGLYGVNLGLLLASWLGHPERPGAFLRMFGVVKTSGFMLSLALMVISTIAFQGLYSSQATAAVEARKKAQKQHPPPEKFDVQVDPATGRGPLDAPVVIVEYSDFECPFCKRLSDALKYAVKQDPTLVRYHFKHYPMDQSCNPNVTRPFHKHACDAAKAQVCAERVGHGWEMHDQMFANNKALAPKDLVKYAAKIGLDVDAFKSCLDDPSVVKRIQADITEGKAKTVGGTPTFFVNGWRHVGARPAEDLVGIIRQAARNAKKAKSP